MLVKTSVAWVELENLIPTLTSTWGDIHVVIVAANSGNQVCDFFGFVWMSHLSPHSSISHGWVEEVYGSIYVPAEDSMQM